MFHDTYELGKSAARSPASFSSTALPVMFSVICYVGNVCYDRDPN